MSKKKLPSFIDLFNFIHMLKSCCSAHTKKSRDKDFIIQFKFLKGNMNSRLALDSQINAEDVDGPSHSHVRYSIVDGNQGSPFTIDPARGELKVAHQLDRERVRETTVAPLAGGGVFQYSFTTLFPLFVRLRGTP